MEYKPDVNVLVLDDNSPDGTGDVADAMAKNDARISVIHREGKLGLGTAQVSGIQWAADHGYDAAVTMDADFSHDPEAIPRLIEAGATNDYVIGSRYVPGGCTVNWGLRRRLLSRCGNVFAKTMLGLPANDLTTAYRYINLHRLPDIQLEKVRSQGYGFFIESTYRVVAAGIIPKEIPICFLDRQFGESKIPSNYVQEAFSLVFRLRKEKKAEKGSKNENA